LSAESTNLAAQARAQVASFVSRLGLGKTDLSGLPFAAPLSFALGVILIGLVAIAVLRSAPAYPTAPVTRGNLALSIAATGTLAPKEVVEVGAEISGRIDQIAVDFDDHVRKGQVLARINTEQLAAQLAQARATLAQAQATHNQSSDAIRRDRALQRSGAVSPEQMVAAEGDDGRARAGVALASAQVNQDESMLSKATIYSPIDGVVLERKVQVGQTIVATMATPLLFTLASDLSTMELDVGIEEAKVGQVHRGDRATFFVDAYPGRQFTATLSTVHNAPHVEHGSVTYQGVLTVDNRAGLLKPGMTANVLLEAANVRDAILVPNGALKFVPSDKDRANAPPMRESKDGVLWGRVWTLGKTLEPHDVIIGATDGTRTVVTGSDLKPDERVVVAR
jgi:HlyD family secretion protein